MLKVKRFIFNPVQENTYVVSNEKDASCIIDPGCYFDEEKEELGEWIEKESPVPKLLLNTHCHLDHVFGNKFAAERYGLDLQIGEKEGIVFDLAPQFGEQWGLPFENYDGALIFLKEGDEVLLGDEALEVLFTPGHSPGSICFYSKANKFVIAGDVLFRLGVGRTDLPYGDHETLLNSIRGKLFTLPDDVVVYPGHGESTTIGFEKANNPFLE